MAEQKDDTGDISVFRMSFDGDAFYWRPDPRPKTQTELTQSFMYEDRTSGFAQWVKNYPKFYQTNVLHSYNNAFCWNWERTASSQANRAVMRSWKENSNVGGAFQVTKTGTEVVQTANLNNNLHRGPYMVHQAFTQDVPNLSAPLLSKGQLQALGAHAISAVAPTNPNANLATFLGELRERLPSIPVLASYRDQTQNLLQKSGGEYLNVTFGWKPMVSDVRKTIYALKHSASLLEQYMKGSDQNIRRRYHFPTLKTTTHYKNVRLHGYGRYAPLVNGDVVDETTEKRWFAGAFVYHVPGGEGLLNDMREHESKLNYLLGTRITPEVLWNLTPWSWMLDWYGNIGDIMHNVSVLGSDSMAMRYGFIMEQVETTRTLTGSIDGKQFKTVIRYSSKRRIPATPYGFGVALDSLTKSQWAILVALGLSRSGPRSASSFRGDQGI
jgi:hypothetical protein